MAAKSTASTRAAKGPATILSAVVLLAAVFATPLLSAQARKAGGSKSDRIAVWPKNHHYWQYKGRPVLLLGGSDEDNLFNNPDLMMRNFETLKKIGGNYIRATLSCRDEGNVWPYLKTKDGRYDLNRFNPEFWKRLERCCREALARDIILQIEFWATFDYYRDLWLRNPFNPKNNINYTTKNTRLVETWPHHPAARVQPFFFSTPGDNNDRVLLRYQEAFVRKVLEVTLPYPNVLYCLDNETRAPEQWAVYWGRFIRDEARRRGTTAQVTEMWDIWDLHHSDHARTYRHPEIFSYTDVSQNNWQVGQTHYDRLIWYRRNLEHQPGGIRPMNNVKVYGLLRPRQPLDPALNLDRWWQNIFAGCASTRFHRPPSGLGLSPKAQEAIRAARIFTSAFDIFASEPHPELLDDRSPNEAYCLAKPGGFYALYFPTGGEVVLRVPSGEKTYAIRWFDPVKAAFAASREAKAGSTLRLKTPDTKQTWLVLVEAKGGK